MKSTPPCMFLFACLAQRLSMAASSAISHPRRAPIARSTRNRRVPLREEIGGASWVSQATRISWAEGPISLWWPALECSSLGAALSSRQRVENDAGSRCSSRTAWSEAVLSVRHFKERSFFPLLVPDKSLSTVTSGLSRVPPTLQVSAPWSPMSWASLRRLRRIPPFHGQLGRFAPRAAIRGFELAAQSQILTLFASLTPARAVLSGSLHACTGRLVHGRPFRQRPRPPPARGRRLAAHRKSSEVVVA